MKGPWNTFKLYTLWLLLPCVAIAQSGSSSMLGSVQCRLESASTISIQYSSFMNSYVQVNPSIDYLTEDDDYSTHHPILQARVCWCSQYFDRSYKYCPEQFDSCKVEGLDGPITCFQANRPGAGVFVRGFWFICVFWFLALAYVFSCTEAGALARAFLRRKLCSRLCCTFTEEEALRDEIEAMIEQDQERATWLLRSAFLRERYRQQRHQLTNSVQATSNADNSLSEWQQTMELKVKKYEGSKPHLCVTEPEATSPNESISSSFTVHLSTASQVLSSALSSSSWTGMMELGDNTEEANCAICLSTIQVGDRIGDIPCGHIYCVECLKDWLKQKNHCPLCMRGGIATPTTASRSCTSTATGSTLQSMVESQPTEISSGGQLDRQIGVAIPPRPGFASRLERGGGLIVSMPDC